MARTKTIACLALVAVLGGCSSGARQAIHVGSKNFTEQVVLGEIIAQHLENRLHRKVERSLNLGGTLLTHRALSSGQIDLYPEYTGTALTAILKQPIGKDPAGVLARIRSLYSRDLQVEWLDPLGIDNGFAMVVRGPEARRRNLETLSDAARASSPWMLGVGYEFEQRPDGMTALDKSYGLPWKGPPMSMDLGLLYKAIEQGQVTMIAANATDGLLSAMDLKVLRDDRQAFPPYQVCIAVRQDALAAIPGLREALAELSGKFSNVGMRKLNHRVDAGHHPVAKVASEFLAEAGLVR
ncbi:MAG: ABC transporter substrate-binding protein [Acidobacteriia bacterium]|nr:ABC transporter substrate-binding protein [Terriglobia bacterium]